MDGKDYQDSHYEFVIEALEAGEVAGISGSVSAQTGSVPAALSNEISQIALHLNLLAESEKLDAGLSWKKIAGRFESVASDQLQASSTARRVVYLSMAAVAVILIAFTALFRIYGLQTYDSPAGRSREVILPDGNRMILYPNSSVKVKRRFFESGQILWLVRGSAGFSVSHRPGYRFSVFAAGLSVQDLGTRFEIGIEGANVRVAVSEGLVSAGNTLHTEKIGQSQSALFNAHSGSLLSISNPLPKPGATAAHRLIFNHTPLPEVVARIEKWAHCKVRFQHFDPRSKTFSGTLDYEKAQPALHVLAETFGLKLGFEHGQYILDAGQR